MSDNQEVAGPWWEYLRSQLPEFAALIKKAQEAGKRKELRDSQAGIRDTLKQIQAEAQRKAQLASRFAATL